ncbi:MAG: dihydrodipicolinate synthase family protein [Paludibacter sp.]
MKELKRINGLIAAPFTAFDENDELNLSIIEEQQAMYKRNGLSGVFICGTTGESSALSVVEKKILFKEWSNYKEPGFKIIAFLGGTSIKECQELAIYAQKCDLDAVSVTAPYYFKPNNVNTLAQFCKEIADVVPEMPFYYYNIPVFTGVNFPMIKLLEIVDETIPNFAGIKFTHENMMDYQLCLNFKNKKYNILWGRDEMLLPALSIGATSAVGSTYGYLTPLYLRIIQLFNEQKIEEAAQLQLKAIQFIQLLEKFGGGCGKAYMRNIGFNMGKHRMPVVNLTHDEELQLQSLLKDMNFSEYCNK